MEDKKTAIHSHDSLAFTHLCIICKRNHHGANNDSFVFLLSTVTPFDKVRR